MFGWQILFVMQWLCKEQSVFQEVWLIDLQFTVADPGFHKSQGIGADPQSGDGSV